MRSVVAGIMCSVFALAIGHSSRGGEPSQFEPHPQQFRCRFAPAGGWNPYGGGLFHWWNPNCFPLPCGPNDYVASLFLGFVIPHGRPITFPINRCSLCADGAST